MTKQTLKRVILCSDFLMTSDAEQQSNLRWFSELLRRPVKDAVGHDVAVVTWGAPGGPFLDRADFFSRSDIHLPNGATQFPFAAEQISEMSLAALKGVIGSGDLLVGYELSEPTRDLIVLTGADYVDIWLHPVRFMDDILFAVRASHASIHSLLCHWEVSHRQMELYGDRLRVQAFKGWVRSELPIAPNTALFLGQMGQDKSVCCDGRFLTALDFQDQIARLCEQSSELLYLRHPYMRSGDDAVLSFVGSLPRARVVDYPAYKAMAHPNVSKVVSISSSGLEEACLMGKEVTYLHKPVIPITASDIAQRYRSIMHGIISPKFWADCLAMGYSNIRHSSVRNDIEHVEFDSQKDKLRDMLGFYWGYRHIDKLEAIRTSSMPSAEVTAPTPPRAAPAPVSNINQNPAQSSRVLAELGALVETSQLISFDIFETLLEREVRTPENLFPLIQPKIDSLLREAGHPAIDFLSERENARGCARHLGVGEEVTLENRYQALGERHGWPEELTRALLDCELEAERKLLKRRWAGWELFQAARAMGKRIVCTSDTYFSPEFVRERLADAGYHVDALYLSSVYGCLKSSGSLFQILLQHEGLPASDVLHIGDNLKSDVAMGQAAGLKIGYLPSSAAVYNSVPGLASAQDAISDPRLRASIQGLAARRLTSQPFDASRGMTGGDAGVLGYGVLGPMFMGFAQWILKSARAQGIKDIYFFARDGHIAKRCCEVLPRLSGDPRLHYLPASRRSTRIASIRSQEDILKVLQTPFEDCTVETLLRSRFGLKQITPEVRSELEHLGVNLCSGDKMSYKRHLGKLQLLVLSPAIQAAILSNAAQEAQELRLAYERMGLHFDRDGSEIAFVDIGHAGTIQAGISRLLELEGTLGLYFSTFQEIDQTLAPGRHRAQSYFADRLHSSSSAHPYKRHLRMFESVFLNADESFQYFSRGQAVTRQESSAPELRRQNLARTLHNEIESFSRDWTSQFSESFPEANLPAHEAVQAFLSFLNAPGAADAAIFEGIPFEDSFNARATSWLIPPGKIADSDRVIWKQGSAAASGKEVHTAAKLSPAFRDKARGVLRRLVAAGVVLTVSERLQNKFQRKPVAFFRDSKSACARALGAALYGGRK